MARDHTAADPRSVFARRFRPCAQGGRIANGIACADRRSQIEAGSGCDASAHRLRVGLL
jgi:hypothetical protein